MTELDVATEYARELRKEYEDSLSPDGGFAYGHALRAESQALKEYGRVLRIFKGLVIQGKIQGSIT